MLLPLLLLLVMCEWTGVASHVVILVIITTADDHVIVALTTARAHFRRLLLIHCHNQ